MRRVLCALLAIVVTGLAPTKVAGQGVPCVKSLLNYTSTVPNLSVFTKFAEVYAAAGFDPDPQKGYAVFVPNDQAWQRLFETVGTKIGGSGSSAFADGPSQIDPAAAPASVGLTARQVDILLSVGLYHYTLNDLGSPAQYLAANNVQSALGDYTGFNVSLYFERVNKEIVVEGIPFGNNAPLTQKPAKVCESSVYEIDTVLLPSNRISDIPPFTAIVNAQGPAGGPIGDQGIFDLPLSPDSQGISVTATGEGDKNRKGSSINGNQAQAPQTAAVASMEGASQAATPAARALERWQTYAVVTAAALALPALL